MNYPVVQDNDFAIWQRYANWAWPTAVIVDKKGIVRYTHIGEGAYAGDGGRDPAAPRRAMRDRVA